MLRPRHVPAAALCLSVCLLVLGPLEAGAVDGVIEINHARALAGGVNGSLVSDPPGYPIVVTQAGSYRLTGTLFQPSFNTDVIAINVDHVRLDLNGFSILGTNGCSGGFGDPVVCTGNGTGVGVDSSAADVVVSNGTVRGMGGQGVRVTGLNSRVQGVLAEGCGVDGIEIGFTGEVVQSRAFLNRIAGIRALDSAQIRDNTAERNGSVGIFAGASARMIGNVSNGNTGAGISCAAGCVAIGNTANANGNVGLGGQDNVAFSGNTVSGNTSAGIRASTGIAVENSADANGACGILGTGGTGALGVGSNRASNNGSLLPCSAQISGGTPLTCNVVRCSSGTIVSFCPGAAAPPCP